MTTVLCSIGKKVCLGCNFCNSASSGQKVPQKVLQVKKFLKKFFRPKSSSKSSHGQKVPHLFRSRSGVLRVVRYSLSFPFLEPSLHTFALPLTLYTCNFVACDFLVASDCFCSFSQARSVSNFGPKGKCRRSFRAYWQTTRPPSLFLPKKISGSKGCARFLFVQPTFLRLIPLANKDNFGLP